MKVRNGEVVCPIQRLYFLEVSDGPEKTQDLIEEEDRKSIAEEKIPLCTYDKVQTDHTDSDIRVSSYGRRIKPVRKLDIMSKLVICLFGKHTRVKLLITSSASLKVFCMSNHDFYAGIFVNS